MNVKYLTEVCYRGIYYLMKLNFILMFFLCIQLISADVRDLFPVCLAPLSTFDSKSSEELSAIFSRLRKTVHESQLKAFSSITPSLKLLGFNELNSEFLDGKNIQLSDKSFLSIQSWFENYHEGLYLLLAENLRIPIDQRRYYKIECGNSISFLKSKRKLLEKRTFLNQLAENCLSSQTLRNMKAQIEKATSKMSYGKWQMKLVYDLIKIKYLQDHQILYPLEKMTFLQLPVFSVDDNDQIRIDRMQWLRYKSSQMKPFSGKSYKDPSFEWMEDLKSGRVKSLADIMRVPSVQGLIGGKQLELDFGTAENDLISHAA